MTSDTPAGGVVDPRAVRVAVVPGSVRSDPTPIVLEPADASGSAGPGGLARVDGVAVNVRLDRRDVIHGVVTEDQAGDPSRTAVILLPGVPTADDAWAATRREVIVDGWRIEVQVEGERRAALRERARRAGRETAGGGPIEVRAIIPGQVIDVSIVPGDSVVAGQQLLVIEAMKMQNELRAPRDGVVSTVTVGPGRTIEVGDLLLVLE